ncbi:MAG TPA: GntR family transcriptional regulator, partial [Flavitalea sp.]|nr:GntR family transcriptional regulator [Flavitalea sp.]
MSSSPLSKLRPINTLTQVDKIEASLQEYFREENLQPGDALPKEIEIAAAMGVSRTAVREALSRFKTLGIIEARKNRGMIIKSPDVFNNMERILHPNLLDKNTMQEIFEMRLVLEMGIGEILFLRKNNANLLKLEAIVEKEEKTADKEVKIQLDVEFHSMLYKISGNKTIQRFQKLLLPVFKYAVDRPIHAQHQLAPATASHRDLLNILKKGTPEEFRIIMR